MSGGPFRWDLVTPAQLGTLLDGVPDPDLWFTPALAGCAGKVLARSGNGDLVFVGRSLDSMFDLLSGALSEIAIAPSLHRLPLSFAREWDRDTRRRLSPAETDAARSLLGSAGLTPCDLARRSRPVTLVDVAHTGSTFADLYEVLRDWIADQRAQWDVIRTKIRFVGVTSRRKTSPNTFRWTQRNRWIAELPGSAVVSVSLDPHVWSYLGDHQHKLTRSYAPSRWLVEVDGPDRGERTRAALAEAVAVVSFGRSVAGRGLIVRAIAGEPALEHPWLRGLRSQLLA